jgi:predicted TIM-barrel fold metal-dependent hydrolase
MSIYTGPIIDAHHHFWQPSLGRNPWLLPQARIPFRYGDYDSIKRDYLPPQYLADAQGFNIVGTVTMETEWDPLDPVGEIIHIECIQRQYGLPNAAVAHAVLRDRDVESVLEELASHKIVRAVRNKPGHASSAQIARTSPCLLSDGLWRRGFSLLGHYGLGFELQVPYWHLHEAIDLTRHHPHIPVTINHAGLPSDRSAAGLSGWAAALRSVATEPQVNIKISGIGLAGIPWSAPNNRVIVEHIMDIFGPERIMFASNFPVDGLTGSFAEIYGGYLEITKDWSEHEQRAAFMGNAERHYALNLSTSTDPPCLPTPTPEPPKPARQGGPRHRRNTETSTPDLRAGLHKQQGGSHVNDLHGSNRKR